MSANQSKTAYIHQWRNVRDIWQRLLPTRQLLLREGISAVTVHATHHVNTMFQLQPRAHDLDERSWQNRKMLFTLQKLIIWKLEANFSQLIRSIIGESERWFKFTKTYMSYRYFAWGSYFMQNTENNDDWQAGAHSCEYFRFVVPCFIRFLPIPA